MTTTTRQSADALLRELAQARANLSRAGFSLAPSDFDRRIDELRELTPRVICPDCRGKARGCATCALSNASGETISLGITCPRCRGARWLRRFRADADVRDTRLPAIVACDSCMTSEQGHWYPNPSKMLRTIEDAIERSDDDLDRHDDANRARHSTAT
jgi:hypothetical protein